MLVGFTPGPDERKMPLRRAFRRDRRHLDGQPDPFRKSRMGVILGAGMDDAKRSRAELEAEIDTLRRRVAALEAEGRTTRLLLHGDPEHRAAPLVEQLPAFMWATDRDLRLSWWAGGAIPSAGIRPEDLLGVDIYAFAESLDLDRSPHRGPRERAARRAGLL